MDSTDLWPLVGEGYFDGRPVPWVIVLHHCGGLFDACALWHGFEASNDASYNA